MEVATGEKKKKSNRGWYIGGGVALVVIIIIIIVVVVVFTKKPDTETTTTTTTTSPQSTSGTISTTTSGTTSTSGTSTSGTASTIASGTTSISGTATSTTRTSSMTSTTTTAPIVIARTYIAKPFVQYTYAGTDLPNQPMRGTLNDCQAKCTQAPTCIGFSRMKAVPDNNVDDCWLKVQFPNPTQNDSTYQTFTRTYLAQPFVQYTGSDTDLPNQPMQGTLNECQAKCTEAPTCIGFSRQKAVPDNNAGPCWLKLQFPNPTQNDPIYHTFIK